MKRKKDVPLLYTPKILVPGYKIDPELKGLYVGVPDKGYKGKKFIIRYWYKKKNDIGQDIFGWIEAKIDDWNRAERFRSFMDKWGRGQYTLGYFKVADTI